jgi:hypothetical protein
MKRRKIGLRHKLFVALFIFDNIKSLCSTVPLPKLPISALLLTFIYLSLSFGDVIMSQ